MKISASNSPLVFDTQTIIGLFVDQGEWADELSVFPAAQAKQLQTHLTQLGFEGKDGEVQIVPLGDALAVLVGLGKKEQATLQTLRMGSARIVRNVAKLKRTHLVVPVVPLLEAMQLGKSVTAVVEGLLLGNYTFHTYKSDHKPSQLKEVRLLISEKDTSLVESAITQGEIESMATIYARDLINESPSVMTPTRLAEKAKSLANDMVTVEVLEKKEIEKMGMQAFLAVARGSDEAPKFIKLTYNGGDKKVVVAGKAITFDSGGLSIKDAKNMETMKLDMSGGAAVLGLFTALAKLKPKVTVIGLIAACENMLGPNAIKPGDVVKAMNGKTIEILNTDAEGRLTLADVLSYAVREKPDYIIDLATLTGACMVALGNDIAGLFANNDAVADTLLKHSKDAGEMMWRLPLEPSYKEQIKSHIADIDNIGKTRYGGAITAALFLEEFVDGKPWIHLDIAGPAFAEKDTPLIPKGGVGFGVRTLIHWIQSL